MVTKVCSSACEAVADVPDGAVIMIGGFGGAGVPASLIVALRDHGAKGLTIISNNLGGTRVSPGLLLANKQIRRAVCSYPIGRRQKGAEEEFWRQFGLELGDVQVEVVPQGTLSERIRAAGAGIPAFYTPTGVGTLLAEGKESRVFGDREYLLEYALPADYAFVRADRADTAGNLVYRRAQRNFNVMMATAAKVTIAEVREVVPTGQLDPEHIVTPGIYVTRVVATGEERYRSWRGDA